MTATQKLLSESMITAYGGPQFLGKPETVHPTISRMLNDAALYESFVKTATDFVSQTAFTERDITELRIRASVPSQKFSKMLQAFAAGMQYTAHHTKEPIRFDHYKMENELTDHYGRTNSDFLAAVDSSKDKCYDMLIMHPGMFMKAEANDFSQTLCGEKVAALNPSTTEMLFLIGAEEMLHLHQNQQGMGEPAYDMGSHIDMEKYKSDPGELAAEAMQVTALQDLRKAMEKRAEVSKGSTRI